MTEDEERQVAEKMASQVKDMIADTCGSAHSALFYHVLYAVGAAMVQQSLNAIPTGEQRETALQRFLERMQSVVTSTYTN